MTLRLNRLIPNHSIVDQGGSPSVWFLRLWQKTVETLEAADLANAERDDTQDAALDILDTAYTRATEAWERIGPGEYSFTASATVPEDCRTALVDCTSGAVTLTLLPIAQCVDDIAFVKVDGGGNAMTVEGDSAETISGAANQPTSTQWARFHIRPCPSFGQWVLI